MSMLDIARFLSYSRSVDMPGDGDRYFNLTMANSGQLFSCLHETQTYWSFARKPQDVAPRSALGKEN